VLVNAATFLVVGVAAIVRCSEFASRPSRLLAAPDGAKYLVQDRVLAVVMTVAFVSLLFMTTIGRQCLLREGRPQPGTSDTACC
jgi:hypothetical protein